MYVIFYILRYFISPQYFLELCIQMGIQYHLDICKCIIHHKCMKPPHQDPLTWVTLEMNGV